MAEQSGSLEVDVMCRSGERVAFNIDFRITNSVAAWFCFKGALKSELVFNGCRAGHKLLQQSLCDRIWLISWEQFELFGNLLNFVSSWEMATCWVSEQRLNFAATKCKSETEFNSRFVSYCLASVYNLFPLRNGNSMIVFFQLQFFTTCVYI